MIYLTKQLFLTIVEFKKDTPIYLMTASHILAKGLFKVSYQKRTVHKKNSPHLEIQPDVSYIFRQGLEGSLNRDISL
jgi:hypothetical protein